MDMKNKCEVALGTTPMSFLVRFWQDDKTRAMSSRTTRTRNLDCMAQAQYTLRMKTNQQWLIAARPHGEVKESDFRWNEAAVADPTDGEVVIRTVYISLDPTNRIWMNEAERSEERRVGKECRSLGSPH